MDRCILRGRRSGHPSVQIVLDSVRDAGPYVGRVYDIPPSFWARCRERVTQIVVAESLAVTMLMKDGLPAFWGFALTACIDNLASLCVLVIGYSKLADLSGIYLAGARQMDVLDIPVWYEWVPSASNIADGGSRVGVEDPDAATLGTILKQGVFPVEWPDLTSYLEDEWAD